MIPRLHVVTDDDVLARTDAANVMLALVRTYPEALAVHVRGPSTSGGRIWAVASHIHAEAGGASLFVNDRVDVALALPECGVHLRGDSLPPEAVRTLVGESRSIGRSVRARPPQGAVDAGSPGPVDFLIVGSAFATRSHPGAPPAGVEAIGRVAARAPVPIVAIGGISAARIGVLLDAGVHGVAVLRAVWESADPVLAAGELLEKLSREEAPGPDQGPPAPT